MTSYISMFMINPSHVPKYTTLHHNSSQHHVSAVKEQSKPDTTDSLLLNDSEINSPPSNTDILNVIKKVPSLDYSSTTAPHIIITDTVNNSSNQLYGVSNNLSKDDRLHPVTNDHVISKSHGMSSSKLGVAIKGINSLSTLSQHTAANSRSYSSMTYSNMTFPNIESEQSYIAGVVKGYERGLKLSQIALNSRHSIEEEVNVEHEHGNLRSDNCEAICVKSKPSSTDHGSSVDIKPIVISASYKDRLERMLLKHRGKLQDNDNVKHTAHTHELLKNNPKFKINLSHVMDRKYRETLGKKKKNSLELMDPEQRLGLLPAFHDESFRRGLEGMIRNIFREELKLPLISPVNSLPSSSEKDSVIDLGQIVALTGDIKDMVAYWKTHSSSSVGSKKEESAGGNEELSESKTETFRVGESVISGSNEASEQEMLSDNMHTCNSNVGSIISDAAHEPGSTVYDMLSEPRTMKTEETKHTFQYRSNVLQNLEVGQVTHLATQRGDLVTYDIICLTTPGIVVEQCWLYWKVVAVVALSSVERDGRVNVGDIVFEIDGQSLRGMDKITVRNLLSTYHNGKVLRITLLKASHKPDVPKRLLTKRSIARFCSKSEFILDDEIRYSSRFKSLC